MADYDNELRRDIRRFAYFAGGRAAADIASVSAANLSTKQLIAMRKAFEAQCGNSKTEVQLDFSTKDDDSADSFSMR